MMHVYILGPRIVEVARQHNLETFYPPSFSSLYLGVMNLGMALLENIL